MKSILCHAIRHLLVFTSIPLFRAFSRSIRTFLLAVGVLGARIIRHPERVPAMRFHPSAPDALAPSETPHRSPPRGKRGGFRRQPRSETATEPNRKTRTARRSENAVNLDELHENGAAASRQLRRKNFDFEPGKITRRKTARENFPVSATAVIFRSAGESGRVETVRRDIRIAKLSRRENPRDESKPGVCKRQKTGSGKSKRREKGDRREDRGARKTESPAPSFGQSPPSRFPFFASLPALESPRSDVGRVENLGRLRRLLRVQKRVSELRYLLVLDGELA